MSEEQTNPTLNKEHIRPFGWGAVIGGVATLAVLFATDWMVTSSASATSARNLVNQALVENLAPICVTQFGADPAKVALLVDLKQMDSWRQYTFIQDQKWSTMPGAAKPTDSAVARECARLILAANP
jgi:hypothetical protein